MTKIERLRATLAGQAVDRPPFTVWYHFGNQHSRPERTAEIHLEFFEAYDLDLLKVMNDYDYPNPEGVETIETPEDLKRIAPFDVLMTPMGNQLRAIEIIANHPESTRTSYVRYLEDEIREAFDMRRTPLQVVMKLKRQAHKKNPKKKIVRRG